MIRERIASSLVKAIDALEVNGQGHRLSRQLVQSSLSRAGKHADFASNVALQLASAFQTTPLALAQSIVDRLTLDQGELAGCFSSIKAQAPGFVNFELGKGALCEVLQQICAAGADFGRSKVPISGKVLLLQPSLQPGLEAGDRPGSFVSLQEPSLEQLRRSIYADCLRALLDFAGYETECCFLEQVDQVEAALAEAGSIVVLSVREQPFLECAEFANLVRSQSVEFILTNPVRIGGERAAATMSATETRERGAAQSIDQEAFRLWSAEMNPRAQAIFSACHYINFDRDNHLFWLRYAYSRCSSILARVVAATVNVERQQIDPPLLAKESWQMHKREYSACAAAFEAAFAQEPAVFAEQKALVVCLSEFPDQVLLAAKERSVGRLVRYALALADYLHDFLQSSRIVTQSKPATQARLGIIFASRQVMANVLGIIGITASERM